jgi:hypothetical protein
MTRFCSTITLGRGVQSLKGRLGTLAQPLNIAAEPSPKVRQSNLSSSFQRVLESMDILLRGSNHIEWIL